MTVSFSVHQALYSECLLAITERYSIVTATLYLPRLIGNINRMAKTLLWKLFHQNFERFFAMLVIICVKQNLTQSLNF